MKIIRTFLASVLACTALATDPNPADPVTRVNRLLSLAPSGKIELDSTIIFSNPADATALATVLGISGGVTGVNTVNGRAGAITLTASDVGLTIGTNVQAHDAELDALASLTSAADQLPYFTGSGTASLTTFTAEARLLNADGDAAAMRGTLGATTLGSNLFMLPNNGNGVAVWPRINADNSITLRSAAQTSSDLGIAGNVALLNADNVFSVRQDFVSSGDYAGVFYGAGQNAQILCVTSDATNGLSAMEIRSHDLTKGLGFIRGQPGAGNYANIFRFEAFNADGVNPCEPFILDVSGHEGSLTGARNWLALASDGTTTIYKHAAASLGATAGAAVTVLPGGNMGLGGQTSPAQALDVTGNILASGTIIATGGLGGNAEGVSYPHFPDNCAALFSGHQLINSDPLTDGQFLGGSTANGPYNTKLLGTTNQIAFAFSDAVSPYTITASVNVGTGANQILQLNGSLQIPAVNASLVTNLNASHLASGLAPPAFGGTGIDSSASTGFPSVAAGTWSVKTSAQTVNALSVLPLNAIFGEGSDGNGTINAGTTTLTRDMFYNNLTISGTGSIATAGFRIFVNGTLDLTAAPAAAITANGPNGPSSSGTSAGGTQASVIGTISGSLNATAGSGGGTGVGTQGTANTAANIGGAGGPGSVGGTGSSGAGGAIRTSTAQTVMTWTRVDPVLMRATALMTAGSSGAAGSSGGGDGTAGGGSGSGGCGGGICFVWARTITCSGAATAAIQAKGGTGGSGGAPVAGNRGGGGGAGGGGGGWCYFICQTLTGTATSLFDVSGGTGGTGGNATGTGTGGDGGASGSGGRVTLINLGADSYVEHDGTSTAGNAGSAHSTTTGGTGGTAVSTQFNLP